MQEQVTLLNNIKEASKLGHTIEAINGLIPLLPTNTLKTKYTYKMIGMIGRYKIISSSLIKEIQEYLIIEPTISNKRSLTLRLLLKGLQNEQKAIKEA